MRGLLALPALTACRIHFDPVPIAGDDATVDALVTSDAAGCTVRLGAARQHTAAIFVDGSLHMWGYGAFGQIGDGLMQNRPSPTPIAMPSAVVSATGGRYNSCAVLDTGQVRCWGEGTGGQLGDGGFMSSSTPVIVANLSTAVEVAVSSSHACARLALGEVYCWGNGADGRLGTGGTMTSAIPVLTTGITTARRLFSGGSTTCVILADDSPRCWGYNLNGGVGNNTTMNVLSPVQPSGLATVRSIAPRDVTTCFVRGDGAVLCTGGNNTGQAGSDTGGANVLVPTPVEKVDGSPLMGADEVGQGINHGCARLGTSVWCWGGNAAGQLGDGTVGGVRPYAEPVSELPPVYQLAIGAFTSCAVDAGAGVWCWGQGSEGELGDGSTTAARAIPRLSFDACP